MGILRLFFCFLLLVGVAETSAQADSLVAVFHFDGNAIDSVMGREGSVDGPILVSDRFGNPEGAYEFDGIDDIIRILDDSLLRLDEDFTLAVWFMPYSVKDGTLFRKNSSLNQVPSIGYGVGLSATGHHTFTISTDSSAAGLSSQGPLINEYVLDDWNLIVASKIQDTIFMTTNRFGTGRFTNYARLVKGVIGYDTSPLLIGSRSQLATNTFHGRIDEIRIYNQYVSIEDLLGISFEDQTTSVMDIDDADFDIHPNPFTDKLTITSEDPGGKEMTLSIYDQLGRLVYEQSLTSDQTITPNITSSGVYFLYFLTEEGLFIKRMIKR